MCANKHNRYGREGVLGKEGLPIKGRRPAVIFFWCRFWLWHPPSTPHSCSTQHFTFARQRQGVLPKGFQAERKQTKCLGMSLGSSHSLPDLFAIPHILAKYYESKPPTLTSGIPMSKSYIDKYPTSSFTDWSTEHRWCSQPNNRSTAEERGWHRSQLLPHDPGLQHAIDLPWFESLFHTSARTFIHLPKIICTSIINDVGLLCCPGKDSLPWSCGWCFSQVNISALFAHSVPTLETLVLIDNFPPFLFMTFSVIRTSSCITKPILGIGKPMLTFIWGVSSL